MIRLIKLSVLILVLLLALSACTSKAETPTGSSTPAVAPASETVDVLAAFQKGGCGACHVIPGVPNANGKLGPDLTDFLAVAEARIQEQGYTGKAKTGLEYIHEAIVQPEVFTTADCYGSPCPTGLMSQTLVDLCSEPDAQPHPALPLPGSAWPRWSISWRARSRRLHKQPNWPRRPLRPWASKDC